MEQQTALQETVQLPDGERRRAPRKKVLKGVKVVYNDGHCILDCMVVNLSPTGACLDLPTYVPLPETVILRFDDGHEHLAQVVWSTSTRLGVRFLNRPETRDETPVKTALLNRLRVIESQLQELRRDIEANVTS